MLGGQIRVVLTLDDKDFTVRTVKASQAVSDFRGQLTRMVSAQERAETGISTLGDKFRAFTFNISLLRFAFADLNEIFLALPKSIIKTTAEFERMTQLMKGLSKETSDFAKAADAASGVKFITDMAQKAPFAMSALTNAFVKFKTGGLDPMDGSLQALVDGIAKVGGTSEHLARASIAIQQMAGKGVVSMEELRQQLGEAVPTAIQAMARGMGMTMQELTGHIAKGEVTAKAALSRMFDVMAFENRGAAAEMMQTWTGMFEQLKTKWELFKLEAGKGEFFGEAKKELQSLIDMFDQPQAKALAADINAAMASMVRGIRTLVEAWDKYGEVIKTVAEIFIGYWAITKVANIMGGITSSMRNAYAQQLSDARDAANRRSEILDQEVARRRRQADQILQVVADQNARARKLDQDAKSLMGDANKIDRGGRADLSLSQEREVEAIRAKALALQQEAQNLRVSASEQWKHSQGVNASAAAIEKQVGTLNRAIASNSANMDLLRTGKTTVDQIAASQEKHATAINAVSFASRGMGAAMMGLRTVFAAMGGWVTIAITALSALAAKLYSIITTADRARRAVELASRGVYTDEGIADQKKVVGATGDKVKQANSALDYARQRGWDSAREGTSQRAEYDRLLAAQRKAQEDYAKADADLRKMVTLKQDDAVNVSVQEFDRNVSREANAKILSFNQKVQAQQVAMERALEDAQKKNPKLSKDEADKITRPFITEQNNLQKQAAKETVTLYRDKVDELMAALKGVQIGSDKEKQLQGQLKVATEKLTSAKAESEKWESELGTAILGGGKNPKKTGGAPKVPPLTKLAESKEGELDALKIKLDALLTKSRSVSTIEQEIRAEMEGELAGGKFDFKAGTGPKAGYVQIRDLDTLKKYSDQYKQFQKAVQDRTGIAVLNEQIRIVEKLTQDQAKGLEEAKQAWEQLNNEGVKPLVGSLGQTVAAYDALFAKLPQGAANMEQLTAFRNAAISQQAEAELAKELANRLQDSKKRSAQLITDTTERNRRIYEIEVDHENAVYRAEVASAERIVGNDEAKSRALEAAARAHGLRMQELTEQFRMTDPLARMRAQFEDLSNNMRQDAAGWGRGLIDMMVDGAKTGDYKLADYFKNLLGDIYRNILQNMWAKPFQEFFGNIADRASQMGKTLGQQFNGGAGPAKDGTDAATGAGGDFLSKLWDSIAGTSDAAEKTTGSLQNLANNGATQLTGVFVDSAIKGASEATATQVATNALWNLAAAAQQAAASMGGGDGGGVWGTIASGIISGISSYAGGGSTFGGSAGDYSMGADLGGAWNPSGTGSVPLKFANGGIMTQWGSLPLRAYSKGGIANRPQAAVFGEGSVPEAYVPLPDGRSIPVTMAGAGGGTGGAAPNVTVNVINQTGTQANAQQGQARFDGKQWVLDVVMTAAAQPGPFRDNMKGALK
ncbi:tape measure protein [Cupriavidus campinensis]|uniref:tape measure protein n=1 Tax=Cupriavidus campinensis TaxID=151783 RepID=UPI001C90807F|nr:tape measure protein [Cupriavidus campinensis]